MTTTALAFELPHALEATEPPEARGAARDDVRLMVADAPEDHITHAAFTELPEFLAAGDLVVVNVSQTLPAAVAATRADGSAGPRALRHPGAQARRPLAGGGAALAPMAPTRPAGARGRRSRSRVTRPHPRPPRKLGRSSPPTPRARA